MITAYDPLDLTQLLSLQLYNRVPVTNANLFKSPDGNFVDTLSYLEYDGAFDFLKKLVNF